MSDLLSFLSSTPMPVEWLDEDRFVTAIGCNLAIGSISNPETYEFLEGHSRVITTFVLDQTRRICISGQYAKESHDETGVPAIAWDLQSRQQLLVLRGHKFSIKHIAISEDARIVAVGDDRSKKLWIWDLREQDLACFVDIPEPVSSIRFGGSGQDTWYLHATADIKLIQFTIKFDCRTFEFKTETKQYANPTTGYDRQRTYTASNYVFPNLFIGTKSGQLAVYNGPTLTIRSNV
jgi:WD40 repeat protein